MDGTTPISNTEDIIDSRDVIARIEYLKSDWDEATGDDHNDFTLSEDDWAVGLGAEGAQELVALMELESEGEGYSDWIHGATLIRDSYFETYAREMADDLGYINREVSWPYTCIDWEKAAEELLVDYTSIDFDGTTYWVR